MWSMSGSIGAAVAVADACCVTCGMNSAWSAGYLSAQAEVRCERCRQAFPKDFITFLVMRMTVGECEVS